MIIFFEYFDNFQYNISHFFPIVIYKHKTFQNISIGTNEVFCHLTTGPFSRPPFRFESSLSSKLYQKRASTQGTLFFGKAEAGGFEPPIPFPVYCISSAAHSTALARFPCLIRYGKWTYMAIMPTSRRRYPHPAVRPHPRPRRTEYSE